MTWTEALLEFALSALASVLFAVLFRAPRKTLPVVGVIAGLGWVAFRAMGGTLPAYFFATLGIAVAGEIAARALKMPATICTHVAVIPLVPGVGLYETMLHLVEGDTATGLAVGARTLLAIGMIAMAIGVASLLFKYFPRKRRKKAA